MSDVIDPTEHYASMASQEHTLGTAEVAGSAVAVAAFLATLADRPTMPLGELSPSLRIGGYVIWAAAAAYLLLTAAGGAVSGLRLRRGESLTSHSLAPIVVHSLVLVASAAALLRGQHSRVLLLRLDWLLPTLVIVSGLALVLAGMMRWRIRRKHLPVEPDSTTAGRAARWPTTLLIVDCLVLTSSIIYLESLGLPDLVQF